MYFQHAVLTPRSETEATGTAGGNIGAIVGGVVGGVIGGLLIIAVIIVFSVLCLVLKKRGYVYIFPPAYLNQGGPPGLTLG